MTTPLEFFEQYIADFYTMQLATVNGEQPWVCTVYFVADKQHNFYWASLPTRRHSQEIIKQPRAAGAIVVQNIIGKPVIGVQIEGVVSLLEPPLKNQTIVQQYADKFKRDAQWVEDFIAGHTEHRLYKLTPASMYLFDEAHFSGGQRQVISIK